MGGILPPSEKWALGARRSAGVNCFWHSAPWKFFWALGARRSSNCWGSLFLRFDLESLFYICFNLIILTITFCLVCHSPLFKFINNLFLKCGAFNIQAYKHFWEKICIGFSIFKIFSKKKSGKIFRENCLLKISGRSAPGARRSGILLFGSFPLGSCPVFFFVYFFSLAGYHKNTNHRIDEKVNVILNTRVWHLAKNPSFGQFLTTNVVIFAAFFLFFFFLVSLRFLGGSASQNGSMIHCE